MKTTNYWSANIAPMLIVSIMVVLPLISNAQPTFQRVFGGNTDSEGGRFRVTAVTGRCSTTVPYPHSIEDSVTGGYITVGTSTWDAVNNNLSDVYIVRTDRIGKKIWENTYDINGANGTDIGASIIQLSDGSGFIVVGSTDLNRGLGLDGFDIFLMKIDCDGEIVWSTIYGGIWEDQGFDLMEARTGSTVTAGGVTYAASPGDILVVGWTKSVTAFNGQQIQEGYIMRTTRTGVPIWGRSYREGGFIPPPSTQQNSQQFLSLTDLSPYTLPGVFPPVKVEDLIAVGVFNDLSTPLNAQGWVVRIDANTGLVSNPARHGSATYGSTRQSQTSEGCSDDTTIINGAEVFASVVELPQDPFNTPANVVIAGHTTTYSPSEIYLVGLTGGIPWTPYTQTNIGDGTGIYSGQSLCGNYTDFAWTIRRIPPGIDENGLLTGHLVITGGTNANNLPTPGDLDAYLLTVDPTTLQPIAGDLRMQFGKTTTSGDNEVGVSVNPVTVANNLGFILSGYSQSNTECANPSDPQDLFLVKTNVTANTGTSCEQTYFVDSDTIKDWYPGGNSLTVTSRSWGDPLDNDVAGHDWGEYACTECWLAKPRNISPDIHDEVLEHQKITGTIRSFPNPIQRGHTLVVSYPGYTGTPTSISVVNSLGEQILQLQPEEGDKQFIAVPTADLAAGTYTITINDNNTLQWLRFIVVE
ncbi:MAG: T9SS C-terminal target domain-containing protein [Chlorobi bacterium CHB2]|nr:T9SS C-terminal target domain-containing protein [Chlorobi bacterium CHB2]